MSSTFGGNLGSSPETEYNFSYKLVKINSSITYRRTILGKLKFVVSNYLIIKEKHGVAQSCTISPTPCNQKNKFDQKGTLVLKREV